MNTTRTAKIDKKIYRITESCIPAGPRFDGLRAAFAAAGVADHVNALAPGKRVRQVQIFLMSDGSARLADGRIVANAARAVRF